MARDGVTQLHHPTRTQTQMPVIISEEEKRKTENSSVSDEVTGTREWRKFYDGTGEEKSIHELKGLASYDDAPKDWGDLAANYREPTLHGIADVYVARAFVRSDPLDAPGETEWGDDLMLSRSQLRLHCPTTSPEERKFNFLLIEEKAGGSFEKVVSQVVITVPADKNISDPWLADWMTAPPPGPSGLASFSRYLLLVEIRDIKDHANTGDDVTITNWTSGQEISDANIAWIEAHKSATDDAPECLSLFSTCQDFRRMSQWMRNCW